VQRRLVVDRGCRCVLDREPHRPRDQPDGRIVDTGRVAETSVVALGGSFADRITPAPFRPS